MTKYLLIIFTLCLTLNSCKQTKDDSGTTGLIIDKNIKTEVEKHIENSKESDTFKNKIQVYNNSVFVESYENDSLTFTSNHNAIKRLFKSFYLWKGDTLKIDGSFGLFTGIGFEISIHKNKATLYHLLSSGNYPTYAYKEKDSLIFRLEVPCTNTRIILSEIPDSTKKQVIYGYVEFKSNNYYASLSEYARFSRNKQRDNMKIYFKSGKLDL